MPTDKKNNPISSEKKPSTDSPGQVELVDLEEMARLLKLPSPRVMLMVRQGKIRGVKVDGEWRFNPQVVQEALGRRSRGR